MFVFVEEYLLGSDLVFESQERLDLDEFRERVSDEGVAVDDVQLLAREERQVAPQVFHVARVHDWMVVFIHWPIRIESEFL